jgi:hypothetical protein
MRTDFQIVIPGRRSEAEANPESITPASGVELKMGAVA